jgi:propionyl-CoA synthetase
MKDLNFVSRRIPVGKYDDLYQRSINDPEEFWGEAAKALTWSKKWDKVLDESNKPFSRWFSGGEMNTCFNALDRHVNDGRGDQVALIYDSPVTKTIQKFTYHELLDQVSRFAGALKGLGVTRGTTVIVYMPMIPQAVIAMLACARLGAVHSVVFGGFAPHELAIRINDAKPKVLICASGAVEVARLIEYKPMIDKAIEEAVHKPEKCIIFQRSMIKATMNAGRDLDWDELMATAGPTDCTPIKAADPLYILYTSGTTGKPKGVVRDNGGHAVALHWSMEHIYGVKPGEVFWAASDVGWVVGHSYIVYGPLLAGCTSIIYEGKSVGTPDAGAFWRVISQHGVKVLFTAPTAFRAIKKEDLRRIRPAVRSFKLNTSSSPTSGSIRYLPLGARSSQKARDRPLVADRDRLAHHGELHGYREFRVKPGLPRPVPGFDVQILDNNARRLGPNKTGLVMAPSSSRHPPHVMAG